MNSTTIPLPGPLLFVHQWTSQHLERSARKREHECCGTEKMEVLERVFEAQSETLDTSAITHTFSFRWIITRSDGNLMCWSALRFCMT